MRRIAISISVVFFLGCTQAHGQEGCTYDTQCRGERICEKGVCVPGPVKKGFPAKSNPQADRLIKTTRKDCEIRGGKHRAPKDTKPDDPIMCLLP